MRKPHYIALTIVALCTIAAITWKVKFPAAAPTWVPGATLVQRASYKGASVTVYSTSADRATLMSAIRSRGRLYNDEIYFTGAPAVFGLNPSLGKFVVLVPERTCFEHVTSLLSRAKEYRTKQSTAASNAGIPL